MHDGFARNLRAGEDPGDPAVVHDGDAVGLRHDLLDVAADHHHRRAIVGKATNETVNLDLGADVATPGEMEGALRIVASQVERLEREIDAMNADLAPLTSFILPSGSAAVASLHFARSVVRRAERAAVALNEAEPLNPHLLAYVNRLSDHLFVAARKVAAGEGGDVLWQPGATRA